jgi:iron complex outermembrane receptor protein
MVRIVARRNLRFALLAGSAIVTGFSPLASIAADTPADNSSDGTSTVEVSAQRQSPAAEAAEKKPQAASVISPEQLQDNNSNTLRDIAGQAPSLQMNRTTITPSSLSVFIRGIGEADAQGEPSVGIFIDGIYLPRSVGASQDLLDVQDITIERGPTGFEGGHDVEGGAIRITTTPPGNTPTLNAAVGYGSFNEWLTSVSGSSPIINDKLYGSLAISHHQRDGIDYNATTNRDTNNIDASALRAKLRATPNDRLELNLGFDALLDQGEARSYGDLLRENPATTSFNPIVPKNDYLTYGFNLTADYRLNDELHLKSITSIRSAVQEVTYDNTPDLYARNTQYYHYHDSSYEQDFRLNGEYDRVGVTAGLYAYHEDWDQDRRANNAFGGYPAVPSLIRIQPVEAAILQGNTELSAYGETRVHFTPQLTGTLALRADYQYHTTEEELYTLLSNPNKTFTTGVKNELSVLESAPRGALIWATGKLHTDWFKVLPKATLEYAVEPNFRPYISISQGQKAGGYDFRAQTPIAQGGLIQASVPYQPEQLTTLETGLKTKFLDGRLQFDTAAFYNDFSQIQLTTINPANGVSQRFNAGNGHSVGGEVELSGSPLPGWTVHVSATALDAQLDSFNGHATASTPRAGEQLPYSPRLQGDIASSYTLPLPTPGVWRVFGDASLQTTTYTTAVESNQVQIPGQALINLGGSYTSADGRWSVTLTARNITNHLYPQTITTYLPAFVSAAYNDPRSVFLTLRYSL